MNNQSKHYCGIDVSKKKLDIYFKGKVKQYDNTIKGIEKLANSAKDAHYVLESTGGYERLAAWYLMERDHEVSIINPKRVRDYAKSTGQFAKTDKIDAKMIYQYAESINPRKSLLPPASYRRLCALIDRRLQLINMRVAELNRLDMSTDDFMIKLIEENLDQLNQQIALIEEQLKILWVDDQNLSNKISAMTKICGISIITALTILAHLPEIGHLNKQEAAALAGLAPYNRDSGGFRGKRFIYGGRAKIRTALYMPAVCAITHNPHLKIFYQRLVNENHCPSKVALTAVMRKMIVALNSSLKNPDFMLAS
jgi:transposase